MRVGFSPGRGDRCARIFAENTRDGVVSHGINRFPGFVKSCRGGVVDLGAEAVPVNRLGAIEQWDGRGGVGLLNAEAAMARAVELAAAHGTGCVGLKNTNHWMRAGTYGLQAADAGCIGICWTNTTALMPPWGGAEPKVGNNPLTLCVPHGGGHVLLDMAMSQYSNGRLEVLQRRGEKLDWPGGYDEEGNPSTDPGAILRSRRALPIGYWKGSGLALMLDLTATLISGGDCTAAIASRRGETRVSQVFMAVDANSLAGDRRLQDTVARVLADFKDVPALEGMGAVRYPGEGMLAFRRDSLENGVPVDPDLWRRVREM